MRTKKEVYGKDQEEIIDKIINIVFPDENKKKEITLYELDNDKEKQEEIMKLIPDIRNYHKFFDEIKKNKYLDRIYIQNSIKYIILNYKFLQDKTKGQLFQN